MIRYFGFTVLCMCSYFVHANQFQVESIVGYVHSDENDVDTQLASSSVTWWSEPVKYNNGPWREAGFLSKKSSVQLTWQHSRALQQVNIVPLNVTFTNETASDVAALNLRYVHPETGWFGEIGYDRSQSRSSQTLDPEPAGNGYQVGLGYYLTSSTSIRLDASRSSQNGSDTQLNDCSALPSVFFVCIESLSITSRSQRSQQSLAFKHVGRVLNYDYGVQLRYARQKSNSSTASTVVAAPSGIPFFPFGPPATPVPSTTVTKLRSGPSDILFARLDWYPTARLGVGIQAGRRELDGPTDEQHVMNYGLDLEWFLHERVALRLMASINEIGVSGMDDVLSFGARLRARF